MEKVKTKKVKTEKDKWYNVLRYILFDYGETEEDQLKQLPESDRNLLEKTLKSVDAKALKIESKKSKKTKKELNEIRKSIKNGDRQVKKEPKLEETKTNETLLDREKEI